MTHPHEVYRRMKELKAYNDMLGFVVNAQYGILMMFPCGGSIVNEVSPANKYATDFDTLLGRKNFHSILKVEIMVTICLHMTDDIRVIIGFSVQYYGLHFRQPWVFAIEDEVKKILNRVAEMES
ncbi:unnamed protein product [Eruca vesicaria subsp. sativa]|uniref:Uncharacterized protein n=1 Tax=Eruca vesicaria subsp. sativa TaxID=29727 RepID=A0ABC8LNU3_ERUVS|nr:unnamed protein product [Eruca vesicaria subsp. sativa]